MTLLFVAVASAAVIAGCGSASTGQVSTGSVMNTARSFAGPNPKLATQDLMVKGADGHYHVMPIIVACKPEGGCELIAPDGAGYADLQALVDDSKLIKPDDQVVGATNTTSPGSPQRVETLTKRVTPPWVWYVGGGALVVLLIVGAVWLEAWTRRRHRVDE